MTSALQTCWGIADNTPLIRSPYMSAVAGSEFLIKMGLMQPIGACKLLDALSAVMALPDNVARVT